MSDIQVYDKIIELSDEQLEHIVLKKYYSDLNYFSIINEYCEDSFFSNDSLKKIFNIIQIYYKKYSKMPTEGILQMIFDKYKVQNSELSKTLHREFNHIINLNISQSEEYIKDNVVKFLKHRRAYASFMKHIDGITIKGEVGECLSEFQTIINISFNENLWFDYFGDHEIYREEYLKNPEMKIATGYSQLDRVTHGGVLKDGKCLFVVIAQPGLGKSMLLSNMAVNFLQQGLFVVIFSLEMSKELYTARIDAHLTLININELRHNIDKLGEQVDGFQKLNPDSKLLISEFPPNTISTITIQNQLDKVVSQYQRTPDIIIVDYINLLKPNSGGKGQGMYEKVGDVTRELRALSYKYNASVITASQVNRSGYNNSDVNMEHMSESSGISNTADFVGALWQQEGDNEACRLNMKILKNRFGGLVGKNLQFHVNYNNLRMSDITDIETTSTQSTTEDLLTDIEDL